MMNMLSACGEATPSASQTSSSQDTTSQSSSSSGSADKPFVFEITVNLDNTNAVLYPDRCEIQLKFTNYYSRGISLWPHVNLYDASGSKMGEFDVIIEAYGVSSEGVVDVGRAAVLVSKTVPCKNITNWEIPYLTKCAYYGGDQVSPSSCYDAIYSTTGYAQAGSPTSLN
ncbi:MAG: hypothetical protein HQK86_06690 [Nitrospinae bacterium]|nr:hypothetical protein [Nitrospinota bacterium]MBF0633145.1 hypothetical protein [Nitrospinota bacterium]